MKIVVLNKSKSRTEFIMETNNVPRIGEILYTRTQLYRVTRVMHVLEKRYEYLGHIVYRHDTVEIEVEEC